MLVESTIYVPLAALLGLIIGSFLNVVILRLPKAMALAENEYCRALVAGTEPPPSPKFGFLSALSSPRSQCSSCSVQIRATDNIPVLSWLLLRGRCRACSAAISVRYPIIETATALLSALVAYRFGVTAAGFGAIVLTWLLITLSVIDFDTQYLPDDLTLPLLWIGLIFNLHGIFVPLEHAVIGAMAGYLSLWTIYWLFKLVTGREGMGHGDFKLLAALGAWLGWQMLLPVVLLSSLVGAAVGIALIVLKRLGREVPIPFGPYLAAAGFIALCWGQNWLMFAGHA